MIATGAVFTEHSIVVGADIALIAAIVVLPIEGVAKVAAVSVC